MTFRWRLSVVPAPRCQGSDFSVSCLNVVSNQTDVSGVVNKPDEGVGTLGSHRIGDNGGTFKTQGYITQV